MYKRKSNEEIVALVGENQAFYGSLRTNQYNAVHRGEKDSNFKQLNTVTISGFKLFSLGAFPCAIRSDDPKDTIVVELFNVTDEDRSSGIYYMELGAGYYLDFVEVEGKKYAIYLYPKGWDKDGTLSVIERKEARRVHGGDWSKFLAERAKTRLESAV